MEPEITNEEQVVTPVVEEEVAAVEATDAPAEELAEEVEAVETPAE